MAQADGTITIDTRLSTAGLQKGLNSIGNIVKKMVNPLGKVASLLTTIVGTTAFVGFAKSAVSMASDLQEVQNVVDTAFGDMTYKMEKFAETSIETFGISKLTAKQTGSTFMAMAGSLGLSAEEASDMAIAMTGLSADMASFYNVEQNVASTALKSVFTGETETLKQYGIVMTEVNLQEFAYNKGITKKIAKMSQAEKVQLRYAYVMEQTAMAQGDFSKTSESWANQTRILSERWKEFMTLCGNGIVQVLAPAIKVLNNLMSTMITAVTTFNSVMGITKKTDEAGGSLSGVANAMEDVADSTEEAVKESQKLLGNYDELNVISSENADNTDAIDMSGLTSIDYAGINSQIDATSDKVDALATKWEKFMTLLKNGQYKTLGVTISKQISDVLKGIDWTTAYSKAKGFGTGLAEYLNGLVGGGAIASVGTTIAGALNTAVEGALGFLETFDFSAYGRQIGQSINNFFKTFNFADLGKAISEWINGLADYMSKIIETVDFEEVGKAIGTTLENIDWVRTIGTLTKSAQGIVTGIAKGLKGITEASPLTGALIGMFALCKYTSVGSAIATSLSTYALPVVVAGIGGWMVGTAIYDAFVKPLQDAKWDEIMSGLQVSLSPAQQILKDINDSTLGVVTNLNNSKDARTKALSGINADITNIKDLGLKYATLASKSGKTNEEMLEEEELFKKISEKAPDLATALSSCNGSYADMISAIDNYVDGLEKQAKAEILYENMKQAMKDLAKAQEELDKYTPERLQQMEDEKTKLGELYEKYLWEKEVLAETEKQYGKNSGAYERQLECMKQAEAEYGKQNDIVKLSTQGYEALQNQVDSLNSEINGYKNDLGDLNRAEAEAKEVADAYAKSTESIGNENAKFKSSMAGIPSNVKSIMDASKGATTEVKNLGTATQNTASMSKTSFGAISTNASGMKTNVVNSAKGASTGIKSEFLASNFDKVGISATTKIAQNVQAGTNSNKSTIQTAMRGTATTIKSYLADSVYASTGNTVGSTIAKNVSNNASSNSTKATMSSGLNALQSYIKGFFGSSNFNSNGENVVKGTKNGISTESNKTGSNSLVEAVKSFATKISDTFKKILGIHSPSKEFAEDGKYIVEGLVKGISNNEDMAEKATESLADTMSDVAFNVDLERFKASVDEAVAYTNSKFAGVSPIFSTGTLLPYNKSFNSAISTSETSSSVSSTASQSNVADAGDINLYIDGQKLFSWTQNKNQEYKKMYGTSAFA